MHLPTTRHRGLVLVGLVSLGLLLAGSGVALGGAGAHADPEAASSQLGAWAPADSSTPLAQTDPPGQATPPNANSSQGNGNGNGASNSSTGPPTTEQPGHRENPSQGQANSGESQQDDSAGSNGQPATGAGSGQADNASDSAADNGKSDSNPNASDSAREAGPPTDQDTGPPSDQDTGPPTDQDTGPPEGVGNGSSPASPGTAANGSAAGQGGPPEWVDAPAWAGGNGSNGPPGQPPGLANGTSRTVPVGNENVTVTVARGPPGDTPGERAWAHVANATPNESVPVTLPEPARNATVRTEQLSIAVDNRRNVSLSVATGDRPTNDTPAFTPAKAAEGMGYISVGHTVPDAEIENVTFRFSVNAAELAPDEREEVALYRYHNGTWNELETEYVDRNASHFVFEAESPGLSAFTVGKKVPSFQIRQATLLTDVETVFDPVNVRVRITNEGGADGVYTATLLLDERELDTDQLSIAAGGTRQTSFDASVDEPGQYTVLVNNYTVGTVSVAGSENKTAGGTASETPGGTLATADSSSIEEDGGRTGIRMPGFGFLLAVLAVGIAGWRHRLNR